MDLPKKTQDSYRVIYTNTSEPQTFTGEIVEKKSRFIANIRRVESEEEAVAFVEEMRRRYYDARHNCSAFVIGTRGELTRCSDDGEPSGTAGRPMLEVLLGSEIKGVAAVVTRYFGGTLLGTGGLVRAYTQALQEALKHCPTAMMKYGKRIQVDTDYNGIGKILYFMGQQGLSQESSEYTDKVRIIVLVPGEEVEHFCKEVTELTAGRSKLEVLEEVFYPVPEK
ncbi:MAG: YigZ family protein [Lachnospiraceae bacterium]|nr:YigZ family protein [Lachnospiraceae bacterium]MBR3761805.1 YigZ family protein [Lachnospiraceae bacterium]